MMNPDTKFLIKRMDMLEHKLLIELKHLQQESIKRQRFESKLIGMVMGASFVVSSLVHVIIKKLGG